MARHPVHDAGAHPLAVAAHGVDVEADAAVADEDVDRTGGRLGVDVGALGAGVLGDVDDRLAGGVHDRAQGLVEGAVADGDHVDDDRVLRLHVGGHLLERAGERGRVGVVGLEQPLAQVALLRARQPGHRGGVVGVLLDQRQRLQHRVVQVGGHVGALLGAHPLGALGAEVVDQAHRPRPDHDRQAHQAEEARDRHRHREGGLAGGDGEDDQRGDDQAEPRGDARVGRPAAVAEDRAERVDATGGVHPALALGLVGLPPQQGDARDGQDDRPEQRTLAEDPLEAQHHAEEQRAQRDGRTGVTQARAPPGTPAGAAGALQAGCADVEALVGRQEHPQTGVEQQPEAAEERGGDEEAAHPQHRDRQVLGEARGDAADDRRGEVAGGTAWLCGAGSRGGRHRASIVAGTRPRDHED